MSKKSHRIYVCEECIEDTALQEVVRANAISERCDYCEREDKSPIACEVSDVIERIRYPLIAMKQPEGQSLQFNSFGVVVC